MNKLNNLEDLEKKYSQPRKTRLKSSPGFSQQKKKMEQSNYYTSKTKRKLKVKK